MSYYKIQILIETSLKETTVDNFKREPYEATVGDWDATRNLSKSSFHIFLRYPSGTGSSQTLLL
jgi:hypothetical protein